MFWLLLVLLLAVMVCSWLGPGSAVERSAWRAFDGSVALLSRGSGDEDEEDVGVPSRAAPRQQSARLPLQRTPSPDPRRDGATTAARRRRITPFQAKKIAAAQEWRCACGCIDPKDPRRRGLLLDSSYEIDHIVPLSAGGTNEESNLQALLRVHHQSKSSAFARGLA